MSAIMNPRQYPGDKPPSLPPRQPSFSGGTSGGVTHVKMGIVNDQSDRRISPRGRHHSDNLPPPPTRILSTPSQDGSVPPLPSRGSTLPSRGSAKAGITRKTFETGSFIDRNSAKAFSNPQRYQDGISNTLSKPSTIQATSGAPPPPPSSRPPSSRQLSVSTTPPPPQHTHLPPKHLPDVSTTPPLPPQTKPPSRHLHKQVSEPAGCSGAASKTGSRSVSFDSPPVIPRNRPPKSSTTTPSVADDLESRFMFHDPSEFPEPETAGNLSKQYPSIRLRHQHGTNGKGLGAL